MINKIALIAGVVLPLFNIPFIMRIVKRRSSKDISLYWAFGVWVCLVLMFPAAVSSSDFVWRIFNIVNFVIFNAVVICVVVYRRPGKGG